MFGFMEDHPFVTFGIALIVNLSMFVGLIYVAARIIKAVFT